MRGRWLMGAGAFDAAPADWRAAAEGDGEPELVLLALAAQAGRTAFLPAPDGTLSPIESLPDLDLPVLGERDRAAFRSLMALVKPSSEDTNRVLAMIAARGWVVHPLDHMPEDTDEAIPPVYAPWVAWAARTAGKAEVATEVLDEESFDLIPHAARRRAFAALRTEDPAAARGLLEARGASLPAEQRLALVTTLSKGLSEEDVPFLERLASDRSGKVRLMAAGLLARLDRAADDGALAQELAVFHSVKRGVLGIGKTTVGPSTLKTDAQRRRREELYGVVSLSAFAAALSVERQTLIEGWRFADSRATAGMVELILRTGRDADVTGFARGAIAEAPTHLARLIARLPFEARDRLIPLMAPVMHLAALVEVVSHRPGTLGRADCARLAIVTSLADRIRVGERKGERWYGLNSALFDLALIADAAAAENLIETFVTAGLARMDPGLAALRFNAGLARSPACSQTDIVGDLR